MRIHMGAPLRSLGLFLAITIYSGILYESHPVQAADLTSPLRGAEFIAPMPPETAFRNRIGDQGIGSWTFEALGKAFKLNLRSNERLVSALPEARRREILTQKTFLRGRMTGLDDSWVRLTVSDQGTTGMIWDGQQLYVVEPAIKVAERLSPDQPLSRNDDRLVIYRYDDQSQAPLVCGTESHDHGQLKPSYQGLLSDLQANQEFLAASAPNGVLHVVLVEDQYWSQDSYAIFNVVDGIYNSHFGITVSIDSSEAAQLYPPSGPQLLDTFQDYIGNRSSVGIAHLMSGREDTDWAGIAYLKALCNPWALGISTYNGFSYTVSIVAHEIGHNAGAEHDQDVGCDTGMIMDAWANGSRTFSSCSIDVMSPFIASAACIEPEADPEPDHDMDGDVDGLDLYELSEKIHRNEINDVEGTMEAFTNLYGRS